MNHKGKGRQIHVGLFSTPMGNHCTTCILNCTIIIAPTITEMHKTANYVAKAFIKLNNGSIKEIR